MTDDSNNSVILCDMSQCEPASRLSRPRRWDLWNLMDFETSEHAGVAMYTGPMDAICDKPIGELTLGLNVSGWHAIHLGLWDPFEPGRPPGHGVYFRLSGETAFQLIGCDIPFKTYAVQEGFWKYADLTGQHLVIRNSPGQRGGVAWIRLEPVEEAQVQRAWRDAPKKIAIAKVDPVLSTPEAVAEAVNPLRHTDFSKYFLAELMDAHSWRCSASEREVDRAEADVQSGAIRPDHRMGRMDWKSFKAGMDQQRDGGKDTIDLLAGHLKDMGIELHAGYRIGGWDWPRPWGHTNIRSRFLPEHPEWRCRDRDGVAINKLSYAYTEVRDHVLGLYRELAANHLQNLDGMYVVFIRGPVFVLYEEPLIEGFRSETGKDPREIDPRDESWLRYRARSVTEFMRSLRDLRDEIASKQGKRLELSANIFCSREQNLYFGLDLEAWIDEGLVDLLIPLEVAWPDPNDRLETEYFVSLKERSQGACKVVIQMPTGQVAPRGHAIAQRAHRYYQAGMDGVFVWDINTSGLASFNIMRRMGHPEDMRRWAEQEPEVFVTRCDGQIVPFTGGADNEERSGGEYGWWSIPPTRTFLMETLDGDPVGRYFGWTGG